jgi:hypothetical protein
MSIRLVCARRHTQMVGRDELFERKYEAAGTAEIGWGVCGPCMQRYWGGELPTESSELGGQKRAKPWRRVAPTFMANIRRKCYTPSVDEGRKRVLLIAAAILAARRLAAWDGKPSPMVETAIADAIALAERILSRIDARWPARQGRGSPVNSWSSSPIVKRGEAWKKLLSC